MNTVKLFALSIINTLKAAAITEALDIENVFCEWLDAIEDHPYSIRVSVTPIEARWCYNVELYDMENELRVMGYDGYCDTIAELKTAVRELAIYANENNPTFESENPQPMEYTEAVKVEPIPQGEQIAVHRIIDSVWTLVYKHVNVSTIEVLSYARDNQVGYEQEKTAHKVSINEDDNRVIESIDLYIPETENFTSYDNEHFIKRLTVVNPAHIFSFKYKGDATSTQSKTEQPADNGEATEKHTITRVFAKHGYSKAKCDGFEIIYNEKGENICAVRGSLRARLSMKWLIVDALVNGRSEQQNEDDFAALPVGDYFDLVLENGLTVGAEKVTELEVSFSMFGRHTVLVFVNSWLVVNNPAYKEAFAALPVGTQLKCSGERFAVSSHSMGSDNAPRVGLVNVAGQVMSLSVGEALNEIAHGKIQRVEQNNLESLQIDLKHTIKPGDILVCGTYESTIKSISDHCFVKTSYTGGNDEIEFNKWLSGALYRGTVKIKTNDDTQRQTFLSLPIGQPFACDLENGEHIPEAIKTSLLKFTFKHFGTMKTMIFKPGMICDPNWPSFPDHKLIQDPHNAKKQYILKRENFQEITLFQLVNGVQVGRAKFTEDELLLSYDFIHPYQLNELRNENCNSSRRLYRIKRAFLSGLSKDWRIDAKLRCINPDSLGFMTHVARENELKPLIIRTYEAMRKTASYGRHAVKCWWCVGSIDKVLRAAETAGYLNRISTTQVGWTTKGCEALKAHRNK